MLFDLAENLSIVVPDIGMLDLIWLAVQQHVLQDPCLLGSIDDRASWNDAVAISLPPNHHMLTDL